MHPRKLVLDDSYLSLPSNSKFMDHVQGLRERRELIDLSIKSSKSKYYCHKDVVCAYSGLWAEQLRDRSTSETVRLPPEVTDEAIKCVLNWMYAPEDVAHRVLKPEILQEVMQAAKVLKVPVLFEQCQLASEQVNNPIAALKLMVTNHQLTGEVFNRLRSLVLAKIKDFFSRDQFKKLTLEELKYILIQDELKVCNEKDVLDAVITWIKFDSSRRNEASEVLALVRFANIHPSTLASLNHTFKYQCYLNLPKISDLVSKAIKYGVIKNKYMQHKKSTYEMWLKKEGLEEPQQRRYADENAKVDKQTGAGDGGDVGKKKDKKAQRAENQQPRTPANQQPRTPTRRHRHFNVDFSSSESLP